MSFAPGVFSLRLVRRWRSWAAPLGSPRGLGRRRRRKGSQAPGPLCPHPSERRGGATQSPQALGCPGHLWGPGAEPGASSWGPEGAQGAGGAESGKCHQSSGRPACPAPPRRAGLLCRPCLGGSPSFPAVTPPSHGTPPQPPHLQSTCRARAQPPSGCSPSSPAAGSAGPPQVAFSPVSSSRISDQKLAGERGPPGEPGLGHGSDPNPSGPAHCAPGAPESPSWAWSPVPTAASSEGPGAPGGACGSCMDCVWATTWPGASAH